MGNADQRSTPLRIFCSYCHEDEGFRKRLEIALAPLVKSQLIDFWHDRRISAGREWQAQIDSYLKQADIILLLVSPDFLASQYVYDVELKSALERHDRSEARVVPILVRPALWDIAPFAKLQALPANATPLTRWPDSDEAWEDIARGILRVVSELRSSLSERSRKIEVAPAADEIGVAQNRARHIQRAISSPRRAAPRRPGRVKKPPGPASREPATAKEAAAAAAGAAAPQPSEDAGASAVVRESRSQLPDPALVVRLRGELQRFAPHDDLHIDPDIPADKLSNARQSCRVPPSEQIVALIDATVLGSAKNALLVGSEAIYYRNDWSGKQPGADVVPYSEIGSRVFVAQGWSEVALGPTQHFSVAGSSVKQAKLIEILQGVQRAVAAPAALEQPSTVAADESPSSRLETEILALLKSLGPVRDLHVHPSIPPAKLATARVSCQVPEQERILGLVDCTTFGSAKHGLLIGTSGIYFRNSWTGKRPGPGAIPYSDFKGRVFRKAAFAELDLGKEQYLVVAGSGAGFDTVITILYRLQALVTAPAS